MSECYSRIFIENGIIRNRLEFDLGKVFEDEVIYEVIRIRKGIPLFLFDHFERLERSASYSGRELFLSYDQLREQILKLIGLSSIPEGNIKVSLKYSPAYTGYLIYYIDARYPDAEMYENGVRGILYYAERRMPVAKIFNHKLRSSIYYELIHTKAYEALLVNRAGCITEGSRSNIFFIKEGKIITAPDECVLGGITRKKLLKICRDEDLKIEYRCLPVDELGSVDSAYMTGTSPNVLPFSEIDSYKFSVKNETMKLVAGRYMQMIYDYMAEFENKYR
ncbi:MAG TPA: aminotransferase class IV [Bacteroidetes bacterium]|nr:aminotransferase class IV [Bacteroidota bacterium]